MKEISLARMLPNNTGAVLHKNTGILNDTLASIESILQVGDYVNGLGLAVLDDGHNIHDDRTEYRWRKLTAQGVQNNVNLVSSFFNDQGWLWLPKNERFDMLTIWIPTGLAINTEYCDRINSDITAVEERLNKIIQIMEQRQITH